MDSDPDVTIQPNESEDSSFIPTKHTDTIWRRDDIPEGMNLNVRTTSESTLVFFLPNKDINHYYVVKQLIQTYGQIDSFEHQFTPSTSRLEVLVHNPAIYRAIRQDGVVIDGHRLPAIVPTPVRLNASRVKFIRAPLHLRPLELKKALRVYGEILRLERNYWRIGSTKVYASEGYVVYDREGFEEPLPRTIDLGDIACGAL
ncbi:hypothetical protein BGX31_008880 [Mortierella sp. GBA43]|nr:hypothetical protein BGX31_008880 [Mortierella sp. GBA43]